MDAICVDSPLMEYFETSLPGVWLCTPRVFNDTRGYFLESFSLRDFRNATSQPDITFVQDNESSSTYGVIRGLHFQRAPHAQAKLVRVTSGRILDVAVDIRPGSPTFGRHIAVELSADNHRQLFLPAGMAHGFATLSPQATLQYKCSNYYAPESEDGIAYNDPALAIDWQIPAADVILSDKDARRLPLEQLQL